MQSDLLSSFLVEFWFPYNSNTTFLHLRDRRGGREGTTRHNATRHIGTTRVRPRLGYSRNMFRVNNGKGQSRTKNNSTLSLVGKKEVGASILLLLTERGEGLGVEREGEKRGQVRDSKLKKKRRTFAQYMRT